MNKHVALQPKHTDFKWAGTTHPFDMANDPKGHQVNQGYVLISLKDMEWQVIRP